LKSSWCIWHSWLSPQAWHQDFQCQSNMCNHVSKSGDMQVDL
jgi:hypothetical protein